MIIAGKKIQPNRLSNKVERLWKALRNRKLNGIKFRRQHALHLYIADFYCHELRLAIEVDGGVHENEEVRNHDRNRDAELNRLGVTVLRFTNKEVIEQTEKVLNKIDKVIIKAPSPPTPLPRESGARRAGRGENENSSTPPHLEETGARRAGRGARGEGKTKN